MKCVADRDYYVVRHQTAGTIFELDCAYCPHFVPWWEHQNDYQSLSGLARYNRMRGAMVAHLHEHHRVELERANRALLVS